ncbi:putative F-box protein At1g52490 [Lycium barbarum]|uniref:putative F-box protein At1g52490 n=1 Tax=Lycium barbarum TaxID=112863 RepID=UPI00293EC63B|nr:putative F-box protein At1g52490 [Lycium barbarum]
MEEKMKSSVERKSEIPSDIISDIFSWLPIKSLCRFKCVSRFYNSLVSDPSFVDIHLSRSKYPPDKIEFLAHSREKNFYTVDLKVEDKKASALCIKELDGISCTNIGYVNGLFLLWSRNMQQPVIYNPTTKKKRTLPSLNLVGDGTLFYDYSFGFEPDKKKYKILMITRSQNIPMRYWIFTLGSSESWREIKSATHSLFSLFGNGGVCIDGIVYFFDNYKKKTCIMALNVRTENFRIISLWIDIYTPPLRYYNLIEVEGKLAGIDQLRWYKGEMDLWILERYEEWVKHTITFPLAISSNLQYLGSCSSTRTPHGEIVLIVNTSFKPNRMFFYDLKKKSWRSEIEVMELEGQTEIIGIYSHVDSLLSCIYC